MKVGSGSGRGLDEGLDTLYIYSNIQKQRQTVIGL
jgi:hypothetical protein